MLLYLIYLSIISSGMAKFGNAGNPDRKLLKSPLTDFPPNVSVERGGWVCSFPMEETAASALLNQWSLDMPKDLRRTTGVGFQGHSHGAPVRHILLSGTLALPGVIFQPYMRNYCWLISSNFWVDLCLDLRGAVMEVCPPFTPLPELHNTCLIGGLHNILVLRGEQSRAAPLLFPSLVLLPLSQFAAIHPREGSMCSWV